MWWFVFTTAHGDQRKIVANKQHIPLSYTQPESDCQNETLQTQPKNVEALVEEVFHPEDSSSQPALPLFVPKSTVTPEFDDYIDSNKETTKLQQEGVIASLDDDCDIKSEDLFGDGGEQKNPKETSVAQENIDIKQATRLLKYRSDILKKKFSSFKQQKYTFRPG